MILNLSDLSNESLQSQIISQIRAMILAGELMTGDGLPSIRQLAREHKISVITVQRAYENLIQQNLIHSRRGKGYFVTNLANNKKKNMAFKHLEENLQRPLEAALNEGLEKSEIKTTILKILEGIKNEK
ncbi:MAG: GntR family transcriptional regulator [Calditrichaeota bacterium]|nr:MAG: GntR family transcriptional regulator [Calditrichota bacterium]MBL1204561.1 GntR family transcriptional regulator [Calditrichota bacterium]NOG44390.1 GntR family transcriptional regulator [Calditrichota bacterium]